MKTMHDAGEPISKGRLVEGDVGAFELRDALILGALIAGGVLFNGVVAFLLIELFQVLGSRPGPASDAAGDAASHVSAKLRARAAPTG